MSAISALRKRLEDEIECLKNNSEEAGEAERLAR